VPFVHKVLRRLAAEKLDVTLVVHFLNEVMRTIAPPCSSRVLELLCEFLGRPEVVATYSGKVTERAAVITFLEHGLTNPRGALAPDVALTVETIKNRYMKSI
jgi:hypothetical protein